MYTPFTLPAVLDIRQSKHNKQPEKYQKYFHKEDDFLPFKLQERTAEREKIMLIPFATKTPPWMSHPLRRPYM